MKPIYVPFATTDQFQPAAILHYEKALQQASASGTRIRALMLCNPHNPLGRCYPPSSLIALMQFCNKHKIHLIADEVYAMSVYSTSAPTDTPFTSVFALDWEKYIDSKYLHQVYGMSKDFAASGLRIGCVWSKNEEFKRAMCALGGFHWPGQVDERVAVTIFEDKEFVAKFQKTALEKLVEANKLAMKMLDEAKIPYAPGANAGFFLWLDLSQWLEADDWAAEEKLTQRMVDEKVFLTPGRAQGSEKAGFFRFVFAREEVVLREGIRRLKICLNI
jgi:1-aminocyclopropane-1-carboxylate synthase